MTTAHNWDYSLLAFDVHDRMKKSLDISGVTNAEMAAYLDVSRFTVSRYLNRANAVPRAVLRSWAMCTGVPFEWLETGKTPGGDNPAGGDSVRHQGLEPRTHWLVA